MNETKEVKSEIFAERLVVAVFKNINLQVGLTIMLIFVIKIDLLHPISWITSTFYDIFGLKMTVNIILLVLVSVFQAIMYGRYHMVSPPKHFTRFSLFLNMFTLQNILLGILYSLSGYFTISLYSSLAKNNFNALKKTCEKYDGQCLIEVSLFLQFGGMWMGLYYFITHHILTTTTLVFPHIHRDGYQQIKLAIGDVIPMGFKNSVMPVIYYCIFYIIWGNRPRSLVSDVYSLYLEDAPLDNILNLLRSGMWLSLWFYTSLFLISVYTMRSVYNIVLTEPKPFLIESDKKICLHEAIGQKNQFNGMLAAQDLKRLAMTDPKRRMQIFALSQPGGHPRNWNNILEKCLIILNDFSKDLEIINSDVKPDSELSSTVKVGDITSSMYTQHNNIRNMAQSPKFEEIRYYTQTQAQNNITNIMKQEFYQLLHKLSQKPGISYFFGELLDTKLKFLLLQAQPVMWICEGLAFLVAASLKEDKYGIVQADLPIIISTLIHLKQNLEKLKKLGLVPRKQILNDCLAIKMKLSLISAVKRSIYKIVITFSKYVNDIPLPEDVHIAIQPFLLCKEA